MVKGFGVDIVLFLPGYELRCPIYFEVDAMLDS